MLDILVARYNEVIDSLNKLGLEHYNKTADLYAEKQELYNQIYDLAEKPTNDMIAAVEARLTNEERKHVRVIWNTPPVIIELKELDYPGVD